MQSVPNSQLYPGRFTGIDNSVALGHIKGHGLFADNVFASLCCPYGKFGMHAVGKDHINDIDSIIRGNLVEVFVIVDVLFPDPVFLHPFFGFGRGPGYDSSQMTVPGPLKGGRQLIRTVASQTNKRYSKVFSLLGTLGPAQPHRHSRNQEPSCQGPR